jgi:hypothetical protein
MSFLSSSATRRVASIVAVACAFVAPAAADAATPFGIAPGTFATQLSSAQAGAHADLTTSFALTQEPATIPTGSLHSLADELPPGLVGNANATPKCTIAQVTSPYTDPCPQDTAVGVATVEVGFPGSPPNNTATFHTLVYNIAPSVDEPAAFGIYPFLTVRLDTALRSDGDYGITAKATDITEGALVVDAEVTFWGVPSDHNGSANPGDPGYDVDDQSGRSFGGRSQSPRVPFMSNPTLCDGSELSASLTVDSWQNIGAMDTATTTAPAMSGCDRLRFDPSISVRPTNSRAGAPAGYEVDLNVPQSASADSFATPALKDARVVFPAGVTLSPAAAAGLGSCTDDQVGLHSLGASSCPDSSKIGTLSISSPLLPGPLPGDVFIGKPKPGDPYRVFFSLSGYGVRIKLEGRIDLDPTTGQITATFLDNPQLPFSNLHVELNGGPTAPLANPGSCGIKMTRSSLTSYGGQSAAPADAFAIDKGCVAEAFDPELNAGTTNPVAGGFAPFNLQVTRQDGEQNISRIDATLPQGLLARLAGVPLCGDVAAATGACPAASQIGTATVGAGTGSSPLYVPEVGEAPTAIYLAGPYKGAPYSLVVKVPAQAGPFDLGTVAVRSGIEVDPVTTQVSVKSDPLPQILEGVPIAYRDVRVEVVRRDFTLNPTSCDRMKVDSTVASAAGRTASPSVSFQVADCERLGFAPKLVLTLSGPTHRSAHPKLRAVLTARRGDANIGRAQVTLPKTEFLENAHIQTICTRVQFAADACPAKSIYGYAKAWSPLLDKPLAGPVYLRSSSHELPDLVASLDGQIHVDLQGRIDAKNARIRNTFDFVPDAPVSKFVLKMQGGKKGLLVNNTELCKATPRAEVALDGQNGKVADSNPLAKTDCGKGRKK